MSQAVLNNSQATGHTDLLSGILKVQVRNEEKITEQDRIYCQNQQDELYKTLDQIAWWYNIFKREAEKYEGKIKLKHEPNGKITTSSYWKIQCKLPPKTKRFCPLKTFNNAPLKSLDRWGYYYFRLSTV